MNNDILFSEKQRINQVWLWLLLIAVNGLTIFGVFQQVFTGQQFGNKPMSNTGLIITTIFLLLISLSIFTLRLETQIKADGIYVRFYPFHLRFKYYSWGDVKQAYTRQYNPIGEYGGWGLRGLGKNKALNVSGNKGIQLVLQNGSKLLIGTNKITEATAALQKLGKITMA